MNKLKRSLNAKVAGHIVMWSFAAASVANVESFFAALHPGLPVLSWGLGVALGIGLVVMAGLLSGMVWDFSDPRFQVVLIVTTGLSLLSGGIQGASYAAHMQYAVIAYIIGLSLPVVGELGVAIAVSAYSQAQRRQRMADAQNQLSDGVRGQIGDAIANIDRSKIEAQVNRAATLVTKAIVDSTIHDMLSDLHKNQPAFDSGVNGDSVKFDSVGGESFTPPQGETALQSVENPTGSKVDLRRENLLSLLEEIDGLGIEALNKSELARKLDVSRPTLLSDISALQSIGKLTLNGHVKVSR